MNRTVKLDSNTVIISFPYSPKMVELVKRIAGRRFNPNTKTWEMKLSIDNYQSILNLAKNGFRIDKEVKTAISEMIEGRQQKIVNSQAHTAEIEVEGLGGELLPFQKAGVAYVVEAKRCIIGDECGLGKTIEALATIQKLNAYPAIVVCPASLKYNWEKEVKKWLPGKTVQVLNGNGRLEKVAITIVNYDLLKKWQEQLLTIKAQAIIYDESHYIKSYKSQRSRLAKSLSKKIPVRLCLSGTPLLNRPQELINQLAVLGRLDDMGGFWFFAQHFCNAPHPTRFGLDMSGASNLKELNERLRSVCYIRRRKEDVLKELPDKRQTIIELEIDNQREYQKAKADVISYLSAKAMADKDFLESISELPIEEQRRKRWARAEEAAQKASRAEELVKIEALKKLTVDGKMAGIEEWIESFLETGEKLVVFAHHRDVINRLTTKFKSVRIIGGDKAEDRQKAVDQFQTNPDCRLIVCSLQASGVGITLTASSNVVFLELGWNPAIMTQASDRCHRIGQKDAVNIWYLLGKNTIDEDILRLIEGKRKVVDGATDGIDVEKEEGILSGLKRALLQEVKK